MAFSGLACNTAAGTCEDTRRHNTDPRSAETGPSGTGPFRSGREQDVRSLEDTAFWAEFLQLATTRNRQRRMHAAVEPSRSRVELSLLLREIKETFRGYRSVLGGDGVSAQWRNSSVLLGLYYRCYNKTQTQQVWF